MQPVSPPAGVASAPHTTTACMRIDAKSAQCRLPCRGTASRCDPPSATCDRSHVHTMLRGALSHPMCRPSCTPPARRCSSPHPRTPTQSRIRITWRWARGACARGPTPCPPGAPTRASPRWRPSSASRPPASAVQGCHVETWVLVDRRICNTCRRTQRLATAVGEPPRSSCTARRNVRVEPPQASCAGSCCHGHGRGRASRL